MSSRASEKRTEEVRALKRKDENKLCVNCKERGPEAVCTTFNTFVCMMCAGIHREYNHRIKNISTSEFNEEEVNALKAGGNAVAKQIYFATYRESDFVVPDVNEPRVIREKKVRDFIKFAYVDKKWVKKEEQEKGKKSKKKAKKESEDEDESEEEEETPRKKKADKKKSKKKAESEEEESDDDSEEEEKKKSKKAAKKASKREQSPPPPLKNLTDVLPNIGKLVVKEKSEADADTPKKSKKKGDKKTAKIEPNGQSSAPAPNLLDLSNVLGGSTTTTANNASNDWADFGGSSTTSTLSAPSHSHSHSNAGDDWANFGSTPFPSSSAPATAAHPPAAAAPSKSLDDLFAANPPQSSASAAYANFGFPSQSAPPVAVPTNHVINFTVQSANAPKHEPAAAKEKETTNDPFADLLGSSHSETTAPPTLGPTQPAHNPHTASHGHMPQHIAAAPSGHMPQHSLITPNNPLMPNAAPMTMPMMGGMMPGAAAAPNAAITNAGMPNMMMSPNMMMMPQQMAQMMAGQGGANMTPAQMQYFQQQMMMQQMMMQQMMMGMRAGQPPATQPPQPHAVPQQPAHTNGPAPGSGALIPNFTGIGASPVASPPTSARPGASGNNAFAGFF